MAFSINQVAINNWQEWLDRTYPPGPWIPTEGFTSAMKLNFDPFGNATFFADSGYPVKGFLNTTTGEVKFFDARRFYSV